MKLKCNVCKEGSIVEVTGEPNHSNDLVCCPNCNKQMAYATENKYSNKLIWKPIDIEYSAHFGFAPVQILSHA